jgi:aminoglycoside phosphotransferase
MSAQNQTNGIDGTHARAAWATPARRGAPRPGDVVASKRAARADVYDISIVPGDAHATLSHHADALRTVESLARQLRVDGWYTGDQTHHARVASYRP